MRIVGMGDTSGEKGFFVTSVMLRPIFFQTESNLRIARDSLAISEARRGCVRIDIGVSYVDMNALV
jgi:hypothetical protein